MVGAILAGAGSTTATGMLALAGILNLIAVLGFFVAWICFMIALRNLAYYLKDEVTGDEAIKLMLFTIIITPLGPIFLFFTVLVLLATSPFLTGMVALVILIGWLVGLGKTMFGILNLLATLRQNLQTRWS